MSEQDGTATGAAHVLLPPKSDESILAAWAQRQTKLAAQVMVPATEVYQVALTHRGERSLLPVVGGAAAAAHAGAATTTTTTRSEGDDETTAEGCYLGALDSSFVHTSFQLPTEQFSVIAHALRGGSLSPPPPSSSQARFTAFSDNDDGAAAAAAASYWRRVLFPQLAGVDAAMAAQLAYDTQQQQQRCAAAAAAVAAAAADSSSPPPPPLPPLLTVIGGLDISFVSGTSLGVACLAVLAYPSLAPLATYMHHCTLTEPYVSGFLAFREVQPVMGLFERYREELQGGGGEGKPGAMPQLLFVDGCGVHHPRRCGLASHLGVLLGVPTIGCAKKMLCVDGLTREEVASHFTLTNTATATAAPTDNKHTGGSGIDVGAVALPPPTAMRMKQQQKRKQNPAAFSVPAMHPVVSTAGVNPSSSPVPPHNHRLFGYALLTTGNSAKKLIFVSPGHKVGFAAAAALVVSVCHTRVPEPIRAADLASRAYIREGRHLSSDSGPSPAE